MITTHFREVLDAELLGVCEEPIETRVQWYQMQVVLETTPEAAQADGAAADSKDIATDNSDIDTVVPLFKLVPGKSAGSYGLACARKAGLPTAIVDRAAAITRMFDEGKPATPCVEYTSNCARIARDAQLLEIAALLMQTDGTADDIIHTLAQHLRAFQVGVGDVVEENAR